MLDAEGLDGLARDLAAAPARVGRQAADVVRKTARDVERTMRTNAPVDTGALRDSIETRFYGDGRFTEMTATIGPRLRDEKGRPVALFVEFGTSRSAPRPFITPAADQHIPAFEGALADLARDIL